ncbi:MAG: site-specific integrase [Candidatus Omnitrophica bacterium]|nr:site-specific integrase [Candidatus Omnitrophota bacterium]
MALFKRGRFYWFSKNIGGKHYRESTGCAERNEAEVFYAKWLLKHNHVPPQTENLYQRPQASSLTLEQLVDKCFKHRSFSKLALQSQRRYRTSAKLFLDKLGNLPADEITTDMLEDIQKDRLAEGINTSTIDRDFAFLRHLFNWGIDHEYCKKNPVKNWLFEKANNARTRRLSDEEENLILAEMKKENLNGFLTITVLGLYTRGRRAEITNLRRKNIDLEERTITYEVTKNKTPRVEPLCQIAYMTLEAWLKDKNFSPQDYIFPGITPDRVTRIFIRITRKLGIKDLRFHDTGKTFTNRLIEAKADIYSVSKLSGHKSISVLEKYYLNPRILPSLSEEVAKLDRNLSQFVTILESGKK